MYNTTTCISNNITRKARLIGRCNNFYNYVRHNAESSCGYVELTFVLIKSPEYSTNRYWKILMSDYNGHIIDVTSYISVILGYQEYNDAVIKTSSYGVCIEDDICRKLEKVFEKVTISPIHFSYNYINSSLED